MSNEDKSLIDSAVDFLSSVGIEVSAQDFDADDAADEWQHKIPFVDR